MTRRVGSWPETSFLVYDVPVVLRNGERFANGSFYGIFRRPVFQRPSVGNEHRWRQLDLSNEQRRVSYVELRVVWRTQETERILASYELLCYSTTLASSTLVCVVCTAKKSNSDFTHSHDDA